MPILVWVALLATSQSVSDAMELAQKGDYFGAETALKKIARSEPSNAGAYAALGELYYRSGRYEAAIPELNQVIVLRPQERQPRIWKAVCLFKSGKAEQALSMTRQLLAEKPPPNDVDLSLTYAEYLYQQRDLDEALKQTRTAIEFAPRHPIGYFWLARILLDKRQIDDAALAAEKSLLLAPQLPYARNLLVRIYRMQGRTGESERQAQWIREHEDQKAVQP
jgi:tetratricopeptide (TPR) repeat protein